MLLSKICIENRIILSNNMTCLRDLTQPGIILLLDQNL